MRLILQSEHRGDVVIVRCRGRIVGGEEAQFFRSELEKLTELTKNVVLQLAEVGYVDSGGVGALVRMLGVLRAARGDLKLCQLNSFVTQVLEKTNLLSVFHVYASETEAIEAFRAGLQDRVEALKESNSRIVCLDNSPELLAFLKVLLERSGYDVFTTRFPSDAVALVIGARPSVVICGPGMRTNESVIAKFRQSAPNVKILHLPPDFSTSQADQAGPELIERVRAVLAAPK